MATSYEGLKVTELKLIAKDKGIKLPAGLKKEALIALLEEHDGNNKASARTETSKKRAALPKKDGSAAAGKQARTLKPEKPATPAKDIKGTEEGRDKKVLKSQKPEKEKKAEKATKSGKSEKAGESEISVSSDKPEKQNGSSAPKATAAAGKKGYPRKNAPGRPPVVKKEAEAATDEKSAEKPADRTADRSVEKGSDRPVEKTADRLSEKPAETEEKPADSPEDQRRQEEESRRLSQDPEKIKEGILEIMPEGYGFIRCDNYLPGNEDVYVPPIQIRRMNLKTGDIINGLIRDKNPGDKFNGLMYVNTVNGLGVGEAIHRKRFEDLTPVFPTERINLETAGGPNAMRMVNLISPIGKGQRGMIVSQPKAGKTTLLKQIANAIKTNHPEIHIIVLLIDERPEEVTDMKESIRGENVEVIYSTFDELPDNHKRVSEMVIERAKRLVEHKKDVVILLDSITRLARAYNLTCANSGRTLSGGLDPAALYMPKRFFGAARNMKEGGSLTILATALVDTGSRMDDVVFEEFKGTGNMELVLDRNLSERRIFPAIDLPKSGTRREDLLFTQAEMEANFLMRRALNSVRSEDATERIIQLFHQTKDNTEFVEYVRKYGILRSPAGSPAGNQ